MNRFIAFVFLLLVSFVSVAQNIKKSPITKETEQRIIYKSYWGPFQSGNSLVAQVSAAAPAPILVKDSAGVSYPVVSFRINYMFKSSYRDEQTQELKFINDLRVGDFYETANLSAVWIESIKDNVKAGDQILFNMIIFKNKAGKMQLAPELKIMVK